jgi:acetylglutamate kinase
MQFAAPSRKKHKRKTSEEYLELAETCLLAADRTLNREVSEKLLTAAGHYLDEAKRMRAKEKSGADEK